MQARKWQLPVVSDDIAETAVLSCITSWHWLGWLLTFFLVSWQSDKGSVCLHRDHFSLGDAEHRWQSIQSTGLWLIIVWHCCSGGGPQVLVIGSGSVQVNEIALGGYRAIPTVRLLFATFYIYIFIHCCCFFIISYVYELSELLLFSFIFFKAFQISRQNRWGKSNLWKFITVRNPVYTILWENSDVRDEMLRASAAGYLVWNIRSRRFRSI